MLLSALAIAGCVWTPTPQPPDIIATVHDEISYQQDARKDYWQLPEETEERGSGDCEDLAILAIARLSEWGYNASLALVRRRRLIGNYPVITAHAVVLIDGRLYDPTAETLTVGDEWELYWVISHDGIMRWIERTRQERVL